MKIFVGSLSWGINTDGLRKAFERFGEIEEAVVPTDRETGRARGFGFITFTNPRDAQYAIEEMNETDLDGRQIVVSQARAREER